MPRRFAVLLLSAVALFELSAFALAGCGRAKSGDCERSPAALKALDDSMVQCEGDGDCPCGSSCGLGVCTYECVTDDDCRAGACDLGGECEVAP